MTETFDLLVIGAGSGGVRAARMAAAAGARVALAEARFFGGTCVNVGCVPKKLMVYAAQFAGQQQDARGFGWQTATATHDWPALIAGKNREIERLNGIYRRLLDDAGVSIIDGYARLCDGHTVEVNGRRYRAEKILLAVGCRPSLPAVDGIEHAISSDDVFTLPQRPQRLAIVGGGYIALEFAGIFNGLGSEVTVLYRGQQLLRHFDHTVAAFAAGQIAESGVAIRYDSTIVAIEKNADGLLCRLAGGDSLAVDAVLYATGRTPVTDDLGLENTRIQRRDDGSLVVDERFTTAEPSVFALGDVIGTPELTPVALAQAMVFVNQQFGDNSRQMDYAAIPTAVFCQPPLASVGLTEQQVVQQGIACDVYLSEFRPLKHTVSGSSERAMIKLLAEAGSGRLLGIHIAGDEAGEILQGFAVAVRAGLSKAQLDATIGIHPTLAEELVTLRQASYRIGG